jgi:chromatin remodeling complex protein RSC6
MPRKTPAEKAFAEDSVTPSALLAAIIGPDPRPRPKVTEAVWSYIKKHRLQDKKNLRMIRCDAALAAVTGAEELNMFELSSALMAHMIDPACYEDGVEIVVPTRELALCIGADPGTVEDLVERLASDLEEMRWDRGSGAHESKLIPALEALVNEAGDPYAVDEQALKALVLENSKPLG